MQGREKERGREGGRAQEREREEKKRRGVREEGEEMSKFMFDCRGFLWEVL